MGELAQGIWDEGYAEGFAESFEKANGYPLKDATEEVRTRMALQLMDKIDSITPIVDVTGFSEEEIRKLYQAQREKERKKKEDLACNLLKKKKIFLLANRAESRDADAGRVFRRLGQQADIPPTGGTVEAPRAVSEMSQAPACKVCWELRGNHRNHMPLWAQQPQRVGTVKSRIRTCQRILRNRYERIRAKKKQNIVQTISGGQAICPTATYGSTCKLIFNKLQSFLAGFPAHVKVDEYTLCPVILRRILEYLQERVRTSLFFFGKSERWEGKRVFEDASNTTVGIGGREFSVGQTFFRAHCDFPYEILQGVVVARVCRRNGALCRRLPEFLLLRWRCLFDRFGKKAGKKSPTTFRFICSEDII